MSVSVDPSVLGPQFVALQNERSCSPDIVMGAYLISHLQQKCENCGCSDTPQWRKAWYSDVLCRTVMLCNACGLKYNKHQYCPYCRYVYYKEEDKKYKSSWLTCETCSRWVHAGCEIANGGAVYVQPKTPYHCPSCRSESHSNVVAPKPTRF